MNSPDKHIDKQKMESAESNASHFDSENDFTAFEADANEGWSSSAADSTSTRKLDEKFGYKPTGIKLTILLGSVLVIGAIVFFSFFNNSSVKVKNNPQIKIVSVEQSDIILPSKIDTLTQIQKQDEITPTRVINDFKKKKEVEAQSEQPDNSTQPKVKIEELPLLQVDLPRDFKIKSSTQAKEIYLSDFKTIDYRAYRSRPAIKTKVVLLTGLPASQEHENEQDETATEVKEIDIPYIDYIEKSMRIFNRGNYKKALSRFNTILASYPEDLNALFYAGLCNYNLNQFQTATDLFYRCLNSNFSNFDEESEWLLAKSYLAINEDEKAKSILEVIISNKGYYSPQAKALLIKI